MPGRRGKIVSEKQRGLFGAELARRRAGKKSRLPSLTTAQLEADLRATGGKKLPEKASSHMSAHKGKKK